MARARSGGSPSSAWAITLLAAGTFIFGLLAVLFYAQKGGVEEELATAQKDLRVFVSPADQSAPEVQQAKQAGGSVVGNLIKKITDTQADLTKANDTVAALKLEISGKDQKIAGLTSDVKKAQDAQAAADAGLQQARDTYQAQADGLTQRVAAAEGANKQLQAQLAAADTKLREMMMTSRGEMQASIDKLQIALDQAQRDLASAEDALTGARALQSAQAAAITKPDAHLVSVTDHGRHILLDIGRDQKVQLGMTFSVFRANELVKLEDNPDLEPQAIVEVYELFDNTAAARVVEIQRGARIAQGDAAVNIAFDADRVFKFYVFGDFDVDGDGQANPADADVIKSQVRQWGGALADKIDYSVDYLVLGTPPALPRELTGAERADPVRIREFNEQKQKYNTYRGLLAEARRYTIPVLNQNRFLDLVGYYER